VKREALSLLRGILFRKRDSTKRGPLKWMGGGGGCAANHFLGFPEVSCDFPEGSQYHTAEMSLLSRGNWERGLNGGICLSGGGNW